MVSDVRPADKQACLVVQQCRDVCMYDSCQSALESYAWLQCFHLEPVRAINCASEIEVIS